MPKVHETCDTWRPAGTVEIHDRVNAVTWF